MVWEIDRIKWEKMRSEEDSTIIPKAITRLQIASTDEQAEKASWDIEFNVVMRGYIYQAALPTIGCLLGVLQQCSLIARPHILQLLVLIGGGEPAPSEIDANNSDLRKLCLNMLHQGVAIYFDILENSADPKERSLCMDLLMLCCTVDTTLKDRAKWYFAQLLSKGSDDWFMRFAKSLIDDLEK